MTGGHEFEDPSVPINKQPEIPRSRSGSAGCLDWNAVIILPGVEIGEGSVIGAEAWYREHSSFSVVVWSARQGGSEARGAPGASASAH